MTTSDNLEDKKGWMGFVGTHSSFRRKNFCFLKKFKFKQVHLTMHTKLLFYHAQETTNKMPNNETRFFCENNSKTDLSPMYRDNLVFIG